jgi:hypothetical protein
MSLTESVRTKFAADFFSYTITRDMLDMTILVLDHYESLLLQKSEDCIEAVIQTFQKNSLHTRMRIHALTPFIDKFKHS